MDVDRSVASATARSSGNFNRSADSAYNLSEHGRSSRQGNVGRSFRTLFKRDKHSANKGWFNPEDFIIQKRQWAKLSGDNDKVIGWPAHLFEQFLIVGVPPTTDVKSVITHADALQTAPSTGDDALDSDASEGPRHRGLQGTPLDPQVLYSYPPEVQASPDLPSFCFPHGVQPTLLERTPSMTSLNDLLYSQNYLSSDASSFIFLLKVADNLPLYGVCCYMDEMLHRPPSLLKAKYPDCNMPLSRYMVSAPRCYCFLTHYPFFSLHMKVLHMMMGLERLDRITMFMEEVAAMPVGGALGLSGRLDSRDMGAEANGSQPPGTQQSGSEREHRHRQQQQPTAVGQVRNSPAGPSPLGSMPMLHAAPPPATTGNASCESAFPLNPHRSYDEEWGTMPSGGGHDSDGDVFHSPHAHSEADNSHDAASSSPHQQALHQQPAASSATPQPQHFSQSAASNHLGAKPLASQPWLQPHRPPPEPPYPKPGLLHAPSAPAAPPSAPPSTPERPHPSTADKFGSPQSQQQQAQVCHKSPSSLLSRASARIRVALEASEALAKGGPADPPPRQPGLPPSSGGGHRRTSSHQVTNDSLASGGAHRRSQSWHQQQQAAMQQAELGLEGSRLSESALAGHITAPSAAPAGLGAVGHAPASPLVSVQQRLRKLSAQSQSGFSGSGLLHSAVEGRPEYLVSDRTVDRGQAGFLQGGHGSHGAAPQLSCGGGDMQWGRLANWQGSGERQGSHERQGSGERQSSGPMTPVSPFAVSNQSLNTVPAQWQTFDQASVQTSGMPSATWQQQQQQQQQGQAMAQQPWQQQQQQQEPQGQFQHQQPWGQGQFPDSPSLHEQQGMQAPGQQQGLWQCQNQQGAPWQDKGQSTWGQGPGQGTGQGPGHSDNDSQWHTQGQQPPPWQQQSQPQPANRQAQPQQQSAWQQQEHFAPMQGQPVPQLQSQQPGDTLWSPGQLQGQGSVVQASVGRLQGAPSGVPLEHRTKTMRTTSFRQVIRSASEGDALSLQAEPANSLQVMQAYQRSPVPQPGEEFEFCPDASLQPVHYRRGRASDGLGGRYVHRAAIAAAEAEAGEGLGSWTLAALCRSLSLDNIMLLLTGALLEKQLVMFCPNIGLLSACVLSLIPLLRPFSWHSLLMPVLPDKLLGFLEAPVPFIIGVQYKTSEVRSKCVGLMRVNLYKDQITPVGSMPPLPNDKALYASLRPAYNVLKAAGQQRAHGRPMYAITDDQKKAADSFLKALQDYLSSICSELQSYTIADVQTPDRVAVLLEDSYIESFPPRDRPFVRQFTKTTMFSVYCDSVIR